MDRNDYILKYADKSMLGLEIAPYHNPLAPKKDGWNCLILDYLCTSELLKRAKEDPSDFVQKNYDKIEAVDIVSSAVNLEDAMKERGLLTKVDYICSSHNFEHLPNPLKFLRSAGNVLKKNGTLSMAIPNKKLTFDYARPLSGTKDLLRMYFEEKTNPDPYTIFEAESSFIDWINGSPVYRNDLKKAYSRMIDNINSENYEDTHVTVYTLESFIHIINDLMILNLIPFELIDFKKNGMEFIVHLQNIGYKESQSLLPEYMKRRDSLIDIGFA
jgi:SAM-dependent methyltransferase